MFYKNIAKQALPLTRQFSVSSVRFVNVGSKIPSVELQEGAPSNNVNLAQDLAKGKHLIVGIPGAYSPACSASHVPGYVKAAADFKAIGVESINVVAVNDAFVTGAWAKEVGAVAGSGVRVLADASGDFTSELDLLFDASKFFGNHRSKRYALLVEDGQIKTPFVEPDNVSVNVSAAEEVLSHSK